MTATPRPHRARSIDWQGVRLLVLGVGVLAVLFAVVVFTFRIVGDGVRYLAAHEAWPFALAALVFAGLTGIAKVVRAFAAPMQRVAQIVDRRKREQD